MMYLCIETATPVCSVALMKDNECIGFRESDRKNSHAEVLTPFIQELMEVNTFDAADLDAVAVSKGPGSYTGLRIGVSVAKGLCYAGDVPLVAINTLESMTLGMIRDKGGEYPADSLFCPMIDARRMEVYSALYDSSGKEVRPTRAEIIDESSFREQPDSITLVFFGDGAAKCREVISHPRASFYDAFRPSARYMAPRVLERIQAESFEDVAYFEPFYLKDFVAGVPKVKGLR